MPELSWQDVFNSSSYQKSLAEAQALVARQFKAVPGAQPAVREAVQQEGGRLSKLQDVGRRLQQGGQRLDIADEQMALERQALDRYASRLPISNLLGLGTAGVGILSSIGNLRQIRRQEASMGRLEAAAGREQEARLARERAILSHYGELTPLLQDFITGQQQYITPTP